MADTWNRVSLEAVRKATKERDNTFARARMHRHGIKYVHGVSLGIYALVVLEQKKATASTFKIAEVFLNSGDVIAAQKTFASKALAKAALERLQKNHESMMADDEETI